MASLITRARQIATGRESTSLICVEREKCLVRLFLFVIRLHDDWETRGVQFSSHLPEAPIVRVWLGTSGPVSPRLRTTDVRVHIRVGGSIASVRRSILYEYCSEAILHPLPSLSTANLHSLWSITEFFSRDGVRYRRSCSGTVFTELNLLKSSNTEPTRKEVSWLPVSDSKRRTYLTNSRQL